MINITWRREILPIGVITAASEMEAPVYKKADVEISNV